MSFKREHKRFKKAESLQMFKLMVNASHFMIILSVLCCLASCTSVNQKVEAQQRPPASILLNDSAAITEVPASLKLDTFYKKFISAQGVPVISSSKVPDEALVRARNIVIRMFARIPEVRAKVIENKVRIAIMAHNEKTLDIPEHSDLNTAFPQTNWNTRARGLGATTARPVTSCAEENLLCYSDDPYRGEDILVHELAHSIHQMGISYLEPGFDPELKKCYEDAKANKLWENTYAMTNPSEYFAEGVQCWFNVNKEAVPADGIHNEINTREELMRYDTPLFNLISRYFYADEEKISCHAGN